MTCNSVPWGEANPIAFPDAWDTFTFTDHGQTRGVRGVCPYCGGEFTGVVRAGVLAPTGDAATGQSATGTPLYDAVECDCVLPHEGRPAGTFGCGGWIGVEVSS
jgi:hypothetical protein